MFCIAWGKSGARAHMVSRSTSPQRKSPPALHTCTWTTSRIYRSHATCGKRPCRPHGSRGTMASTAACYAICSSEWMPTLSTGQQWYDSDAVRLVSAVTLDTVRACAIDTSNARCRGAHSFCWPDPHHHLSYAVMRNYRWQATSSTCRTIAACAMWPSQKRMLDRFRYQPASCDALGASWCAAQPVVSPDTARAFPAPGLFLPCRLSRPPNWVVARGRRRAASGRQLGFMPREMATRDHLLRRGWVSSEQRQDGPPKDGAVRSVQALRAAQRPGTARPR